MTRKFPVAFLVLFVLSGIVFALDPLGSHVNCWFNGFFCGLFMVNYALVLEERYLK